MPRRTECAPGDGSCPTRAWLDRAHWCSTCDEGRYYKNCQNKSLFDNLTSAERESYRRGSAPVEIEMTDMRPSATDAAERIRQLLRAEEEEICPVERV